MEELSEKTSVCLFVQKLALNQVFQFDVGMAVLALLARLETVRYEGLSRTGVHAAVPRRGCCLFLRNKVS